MDRNEWNLYISIRLAVEGSLTGSAPQGGRNRCAARWLDVPRPHFGNADGDANACRFMTT